MRTTGLRVTALTILTLGSPAVATAAQPSAADRTYRDLRSPDAKDAARLAVGRTYHDLRSPDAKDAAAIAIGPTYRDLRSPDAKDAAADRIVAPFAEVSYADGFDWGDAAIGAGGAVGLLAISVAGAMTLRRRPVSH